MFERARTTSDLQRFGWIFLTGLAAGATIWCTHFVAMLGYEVRVPLRLNAAMTILSLIVAIVGMSIGLTVALWRQGLVFALAGGALAGGAISAMHFIGMAAFRVDGLVEWRASYIVAALVCSFVFSAAAFSALCSTRLEGRHRILLGATLFAVAVITLHFTAMTAVRVVPLALSDKPLDSEGMRDLGLATALVGLMVIAAGVAAALIDRRTRSDALRRLRHMAMNDALTGLPNRSGFQAEFQLQIGVAGAAGTKLAVVAVDLDRFKQINDAHGHKAGDDLLVTLATRMRDQLHGSDMVARLGGDEFVALLRHQDRDSTLKLVGRLHAALKAPVSLGPVKARVGAAVGIAVFPDDAQDAEALLGNADLAMYRAKREGSFELRFYDAAIDEAVRERRQLASDLRGALDRGELELHYQAQASVMTRQVTGYEALLRWKHPVRGSVSPSVFIPVAEENGLMLALGEWTLQQACRGAAAWAADSKVSVKVSPLQLVDGDLPGLLQQLFLETGLPPHRLELELKEKAIMLDRTRTLHVLRQIKALGVGVALDDFGAGYSSLETLRVFPFSKIKLDRSFISGLADDLQAIGVMRAVLALGRSLSIPVLAEGVETDDQLEVLRREGCDEAQGSLLGRPAPVSPPAPARAAVHMEEDAPRDRPLGGIATQPI
jgi:diguanylate cyclase (GGDEF)-like protein